MPDAARVRDRRVEYHEAAAVRAVSGELGAELRARVLRVDGRRVSLASPYQAEALEDVPLTRVRGVADGLAVLLRYSDLELHERLRPADRLERVIFDVLEQLRCESLVPARLVGLRANLDAAYLGWCRDARAGGVGEGGVALLVYTLVHMVRGRLINRQLEQEVDEIVEVTRGNLARLVGHALWELPGLRVSQIRFGEPANEIARLVGELAADSGAGGGLARGGKGVRGDERLRLFVPPGWDDASDPDVQPRSVASMVGSGGPPLAGLSTVDPLADLSSLGDYRVYTRDFDRRLVGTQLHTATIRARLRIALDHQVTAQPVSIPRLALRLRAALGHNELDTWAFGEEEGVLDAGRLSQLIANPTNHRVFRRHQAGLQADAVVSFLVDNSGSMKRQRYETVAVLVDTFARALDLAGMTSEVLGFTTGAWDGGRSAQEWRGSGSPAEPGRLNDVDHIVYKDADTPWRRARPSMAAMFQPTHFREGVDGEALIWAHQRLLARPERRRVLVVISDGAPMDTATDRTNRDGFLDDHLRAVADQIERTSPVELVAIGVDLDLARSYRNSITLELGSGLTLADYAGVERLMMHQ